MDIKDVNVGGIYYIPVEVISVDDEVQAYYAKRKDKGLWDDFDAVDMVTKEEIVGTEIDDRVDFWKRDSESAHEEIRKLQDKVKRLEDSNGQYAEQIQKYDNTLTNTQDKVVAQIKQLAQTEKRCADLQKQLERLNTIKDEAIKYKELSGSLRRKVDELEADKARPVCVAVNEVESPKIKALSKALREQGQVIRQKNATINALADRVVYLEGEMKKNG